MSDPLRREEEFHDALAAELDPAGMPPSPPDHLEAAMFACAGDVSGLRVLDLGCGSGDITLQLLSRGAEVTALDLSSRMVEVARRRAERFFPGAPADFVAAPAEATGLPDAVFDMIVGKWVLHHVDLRAVAGEIARTLKPGRRAVFIENSGENPLLRFARNHLAGRFGIPRFGTEDEHPLVKDDYRLLASCFGRLELVWPDFFFFRLFDRQVLRYRSERASRYLARMDDLIFERAPRLRPYSFHLIVHLER